ncbi:hypothetical protein EDF68_1236 [Ochrobactrum sp. BH3]|nr:hypothetical protein EDF68_1236 [Ochrobactrum sp. BH3]
MPMTTETTTLTTGTNHFWNATLQTIVAFGTGAASGLTLLG